MALKIPYATVDQADSYLAGNTVWIALSDSEKDTHLINGRYYIDASYSCSEEVDMDAIDEEYVYANSLLAAHDLSTGLFTVSETGNSPVVEKRVKAGSVETEKVYAGNRSSSLRLNAIDLYPEVTALLSAFCSLSKINSVKNQTLLRN